jgi:hypothetical protein
MVAMAELQELQRKQVQQEAARMVAVFETEANGKMMPSVISALVYIVARVAASIESIPVEDVLKDFNEMVKIELERRKLDG